MKKTIYLLIILLVSCQTRESKMKSSFLDSFERRIDVDNNLKKLDLKILKFEIISTNHNFNSPELLYTLRNKIKVDNRKGLSLLTKYVETNVDYIDTYRAKIKVSTLDFDEETYIVDILGDKNFTVLRIITSDKAVEEFLNNMN